LASTRLSRLRVLVMINTKLISAKILIAITFLLSIKVLARCVFLLVDKAFLPLDYFLFGVLGLAGAILAVLKNNQAKRCLLAFYAAQMFFIRTKYINIVYNTGVNFAFHVSSIRTDPSKFPQPGVTINFAGIALFLLVFWSSVFVKGAEKIESGEEWQCPECEGFNSYSMLRCKCGYEYEE
jgi:hypothetical protein